MARNCSLTLQAFDDDGVTVLWEVGTDPSHFNPYLCEPEHYGEQEIDIVRGSSVIAQVEVIVIDKAQVPGDQRTGWLTERIVEGGIDAIQGRRFRLTRFINDEVGSVVIADGPAGTPRLDASYSAYRWVIRDTRDTERKLVAFQSGSNWQFYPPGLIDGPWGYNPGDDTYLVEQALAFGTADVTDFSNIDGIVQVGLINLDPDDTIITQAMLDAREDRVTGSGLFGGLTYGRWVNLLFKWRYVGEGEEDWRSIVPGARAIDFSNSPFFDADFFNLPTPGNTLVRFLFGVNTNDGEEAPDVGESIEFTFSYIGPISEQFPYHVGGITSGQFLKNLYDGVYSPRDPVTGEIVPSGIRYNEADLLAMTDEVLLRIEEPIQDARAWSEENVYAPSGWVPALNNEMEISPITQRPPESFVGITPIDDTIVEPSPDWNAGEIIFNELKFTYKRYYRPNELVESVDGLESRNIIIEFTDPISVKRHSSKPIEYEALAFSAVGNVVGEQLSSVATEVGRALADDRFLYVFNRYKDAAQIVRIAVRRALIPTTIRVGSFVVTDLSWIPDYLLKQRGGSFGGQIISIRDIDCAWRDLLVEEILPLSFS